jgi:hypothetical protein
MLWASLAGVAGAVGLSHCDFLVYRFTKNLP